MKLPAYPKYKPSGVEWLPELPDHWGHVALRWTAHRYSGGTPDKGNDDYWEDGDIPWLNSGAVNDGYITAPSTFITRAGLSSSSAKWIPKDALVMALAGQGKTKGMVAQLGIATTCNQSMAAIIPTERLRSRYLYWWLAANYQNIRNMAGGEARDGLNLDLLGTIPCPLPSDFEQRAIATLLDRETAKIDTLVAKKMTLVDRLKEKRTALISRTVTRGLPPDAARAASLDPHPKLKPSGIDWLGDVPAHWRTLRLKNISPRISGRLVYQPAQYFDDEGVPFLMGNNITERGIKWDDVKFIPSQINEIFSQYALREGDVITVRVGAPGLTCVVPKEADGLNCGSMMIIRRSPKFDSRWLSIVMNSFLVKTQIDQVQYGAAQEQINITDAVNFQIPTPPLIEQAAIAAFASEETAKLDTLAAQVQSVIERLQEYRTALITAAVTGKIDVRQAPASG